MKKDVLQVKEEGLRDDGVGGGADVFALALTLGHLVEYKVTGSWL